MAKKSVCRIEGCGNSGRITRGMCQSHYKRWLRHGDPLAGGTPLGEPRRWLETVAIPYAGDDCLIWPYYRRQEDGRAALNMGKGRSWLAHRVVCEAVHGKPQTSGMDTCHSCGNGHLGCVNPRHLYWGTHAENQQDMVSHGRSARGERSAQARLTERDVREIRELRRAMTQKGIATMFGVHIMTVNDIVHRRTWGWLE